MGSPEANPDHLSPQCPPQSLCWDPGSHVKKKKKAEPNRCEMKGLRNPSGNHPVLPRSQGWMKIFFHSAAGPQPHVLAALVLLTDPPKPQTSMEGVDEEAKVRERVPGLGSW